MEPATPDASGSASIDSDSQRKGVRISNASLSDDAPPPPPPPGPPPPPREEQPTTPRASAWNEDDDDDAAVARLMDEYEALKAERQALAARLAARQRAEAAESAKIEAELEALAAETVALNREMARREASVYADGPMQPETRPRQFRRKPSVTSTPWR